MILFSAFILALAITVALIPPLMKGAVRLAIVDVPDDRKVHTGAVPRVGGIAMVIGAIVPMLLWVPMDQTLSGFLTALAVLLMFGAWDDSRDLDYRLKFLGQLLAALIVVYVGGIKIAVFPFAGLDPVRAFDEIFEHLVGDDSGAYGECFARSEPGDQGSIDHATVIGVDGDGIIDNSPTSSDIGIDGNVIGTGDGWIFIFYDGNGKATLSGITCGIGHLVGDRKSVV